MSWCHCLTVLALATASASPPGVAAGAEPPTEPSPEAQAAADVGDPVRQTSEEVAFLVEQELYDDALALIRRRQADDDDPAYVFMEASIEELAGRCTRAVTLYREFLRLAVPADDRQAAIDGLERCGEPYQEVDPEPPQPEPPPPRVQPEPRPVQPREPVGPPWYRDPAGMSLTVIGIAGIGAGAGLWVQAAVDARAAEDAGDLGDYRLLEGRSGRLEVAGITVLAVGAALTLGGAIRLALVAGRRRGPTNAARLGAGGLSVRF